LPKPTKSMVEIDLMELRRLRQENHDYQLTFDLQRSRMKRATQMWRKANPGNEMVLPDLGRLLEWLLKEARK